MSIQPPLVVVGSINLDLVAVAERIPAVGQTVTGTDFQIYPGGKGANQAVAIARLGYPVQLIGRVGADAFGAQLRSHLQSATVDIAAVETSDGPSGVALIVVSSSAENSIVVVPGANAKLTPQDIETHLAMIREAGMVLTQLEIPLGTVEYLAEICAREDVPLILDPAPARALPRRLLEQVDWFTPNETEATFFAEESNRYLDAPLAPRMARLLMDAGCRGVVLKRGADGVYVATTNGVQEAIAAFPVTAIDTTAAGDTFNGAFAVGLMLGKSPEESARFAAAAAAVSVTRPGAQPSMPTMADVEALITDLLPTRS